jgi:hypothetical protein
MFYDVISKFSVLNTKISYLRLSYQIPLITAIAIIATTVVNIVAFQYFMTTLFVVYTDEIASNEQK